MFILGNSCFDYMWVYFDIIVMIESFCLMLKIFKVYYVDEWGIIEELYDLVEDMLKKKGFVIKVKKLFKWKNLFVVKVFFCDC